MVKWKRSEATEKGLWIILAFIILFAIAMIIIYMAKSGPQNISAVLDTISNAFGGGSSGGGGASGGFG